MSDFINIAEQQVIKDVSLHAASSYPVNNKNDLIELTHNLGVAREPEDAHRELTSLGYTVVKASTVTHQNVPKPGSTRQLTPRGEQTWQYTHPQKFKATMNMRDSGSTSVTMKAPAAHHERFRARLDMKPHSSLKKMAEDSKQTDAKIKDSQVKPKRTRVNANAEEELKLSRNSLYAGGPGSGRHKGAAAAEKANTKQAHNAAAKFHQARHAAIIKEWQGLSGNPDRAKLLRDAAQKHGEAATVHNNMADNPKSGWQGQTPEKARALSKIANQSDIALKNK